MTDISSSKLYYPERMMNMRKTALKAIRFMGRVGSDRKLEFLEDAVELPEGDVEVILLYDQSIKRSERLSLSK